MSDISNTADKLVGRAKEAAGDALGNDDLRAEGKADRSQAEVKETAENVKDGVKDGIEKAADAATDAAGAAKQKVADLVGEAKDAAADKTKDVEDVKQDVKDVKDTVRDTADQVAAKVDRVVDETNGTGLLIGVGAAVVALAVTWIAYRSAKASVKRHPAVRVARAGVHAVHAARDH